MTIGEEVPEVDEPGSEDKFNQAVKNNQPTLALQYLVGVVADMKAEISKLKEELFEKAESEISKLKGELFEKAEPVKKAVAATKAKVKANKTEDGG